MKTWEILNLHVPESDVVAVVRWRQRRIWHGRIDVAVVAGMWDVRWRRGEVRLREVLGQVVMKIGRWPIEFEALDVIFVEFEVK